MSRNLKQVYDDNPASSMLTTDLFYVARSPFTIADNFGITWDNTQKSITAVNTITSGTWNAGVIDPIYGGTGKNNGANTITIGGAVSLEAGLQIIGAQTPIIVNHANFIYNLPQVSNGILSSNLGGGLVNGTPKLNVYDSAGSQSIPTGTYTQVTLNTVVFDTNSGFSASVYTIPITGYYQVNAQVSIELDNTDTQVLIILQVNVNGGTIPTLSTSILTPSVAYIGSPIEVLNVSSIVRFTVGDMVNLLCFQDSVGSRNTFSAFGTSGTSFLSLSLIV